MGNQGRREGHISGNLSEVRSKSIFVDICQLLSAFNPFIPFYGNSLPTLLRNNYSSIPDGSDGDDKSPFPLH